MASNFYHKHVKLSLLLVLWICTSPSLADDLGQLKKVEAALTARQYAEAEKMLKPLADGGNGRAAYLLGDLYMNGSGVPQNYSKGKQWLEKAAAAGQATNDGEYQIGRTYFEGLGTPKDYNKAYYWLSKGAADGNPHAMNDLSVMYLHGYGVDKDNKKALELQLKAAKNGCPYAKLSVAEKYEEGHSLPKDLKKARALYEESAAEEVVPAMEHLSWLLEKRDRWPAGHQASAVSR